MGTAREKSARKTRDECVSVNSVLKQTLHRSNQLLFSDHGGILVNLKPMETVKISGKSWESPRAILSSLVSALTPYSTTNLDAALDYLRQIQKPLQVVVEGFNERGQSFVRDELRTLLPSNIVLEFTSSKWLS